MPNLLKRTLRNVPSFVALASLLGCNSVIGLNKLSISENAQPKASTSAETGPAPECTSNADCTEQLTAANTGDAGLIGGKVPGICTKPDGKCAQLTSDDCTTITGDYLNDSAIVIGSLFATQGTTAAQNIPRQQSATLAIEEVNTANGIPTGTAGSTRPLVMVSCNTTGNLVRAATHLVQDIGVPAIVGPNTSQDTLDVSNKVTIQAGVVVISPSAVAASISDLNDNDLTWLVQPSDNQRAVLMMKNINDLETTLKAPPRSLTNVKLSIIYRNDALGVGTRTSMDQLTINGQNLSAPINFGSPTGNVHIDSYEATQTDFSAILTKESTFQPDIVVLAGTAESITKVLSPLEQALTAVAAPNHPYYYIIDPAKGPDLITAVTGNDDLRLRVRGSGAKPAPDSAPVTVSFNLDYATRYGGSQPTASGTGPSYDAAYAISYALATIGTEPITGANIAKGLRKLAGGSVTVDTGTRDVLSAFNTLSGGGNITGIGTTGPLEWDSKGAVMGGTIEMWCIGKSGTTPVFQSSGLTYDIKTQQNTGSYTQCQ